jgi:hypothetical protein
MKKIYIAIILIVAVSLFAAQRATEPWEFTEKELTHKNVTIGDYDSTLRENYQTVTVVTSDTLAYVDTNEHAFTLDNALGYYEVNLYSAYVVEVQIIYRGNPNDVNLVISTASSGQELSAANAISQLDDDYWASKTIDLNTSGGTGTEYYLLPDALFNGEHIYFKYSYSGDPGNDVKVAIFVTRI